MHKEYKRKAIFVLNVSDIMHHKEKMIQCQAKELYITDYTNIYKS
jgi:purine-nucleoside phosphorylase